MNFNFSLIRRAFFFSGFFALLMLGGGKANAAVCNITSTTTINQAYIDGNSCDTLNIMGGSTAPAITWSEGINLVGSGSLVVGSGTSTFMGALVLDASDSMTVTSTGRITHWHASTTGVSITAQTLTIDSGGRIDVLGRGCSGGAGNAVGSGPGWSTDECTTNGRGAGAGGTSLDGGAGGTHGGVGGSSGTTGIATTTRYGSALAPVLVGAGGGGGWGSGAGGQGGRGGGLIVLSVTGTLTINGVIQADGQSGSYAGSWTGGGGGAGGSVNIVAGTITGSGSISANGGSGPSAAGAGGGGGRIRIQYGSLGSFAISSASAAAGSRSGATTSASNGSGFALDRVTDDGVGTMTVFSGFDFPSVGDYTRDAIIIQSGSQLACSAATTTSLTVSSVAWLGMSSVSWSCATGYTSVALSSSAGISTTSTSISFSSATSVAISAPVWTNVTTTLSNTQAGATTDVSIASALTFTGFVYNGPSHAGYFSTSGGFFSLHNAIAITMVSSTIYSSVSSTLLTSISIDSRSSIVADGRGCSGARSEWGGGYGPSWLTDICIYRGRGVGAIGGSLDGGAGATYGGVGGSYGSSGIATSTTYGSSTLPALFGAGGGGGWSGYGVVAGGGAGGGIVNISVSGVFLIDGIISANGASGTYGGAWGGGGAGSGGSIALRAGTLSGAGYVYARGGGGAPTSGAAGGGGRVAVRYSTLGSFSLSNLLAPGGVKTGSGTNGSAGTTYTLQTNQSPTAPSSLGQTSLTNGSTTGTTTPIFSFTLADADVSDTVKFQIQIDNSSDFGSLVIDYTSALAAQGTASFQVGQSAGSGSYSTGAEGQTLSDGSYYWRVKTIDQNAAESSYTTANSGSVAFIVDSATRSVSFLLGTGSGAESVTATSIRIVLSTTHFETVTVNYAVSSTLTTATGGGTDYTLASGTATIAAGETSTTIDLAVVSDAIDEPNEVVAIELASPSYASLGASSLIEYTIEDDDGAGVTLSKTTAAVTEGGVTDSYTIVLASQPTSTVRLTFTTSTYGVTVDSMYVDFTSGNWNSPQTVTITATNDSVDEPATGETLIATALSVPSGSAYGYDVVSVSDVIVTVTDNDTAGVTLSKTTAAVTEGGVTDSYTIVLASQPTSTVRLTFTTSTYGVTMSATSVDFTELNWDTPQNITITATNDSIAEGTVTASVTHTATVPSGYSYGYSSGVSVENMVATISDNDTAGVSASTNSVSVTEGGSAQTLTFVLDTMPTSTVTLTFTTSTKGITVSPMTMAFTSENWGTPQTLSILATDDSSYEASHSTTVQFTVSSNAYAYPSVTPPTVTVAITDNDTSSITLSASTFTIREGASDTFTIVLVSQPTSTVAIGFTVPNQLRVSTSSVSFSDSTWSTPQTVTITPVDDDRYAGTRTESIQVYVTTETAFASAEVPHLAVTITDNEQAVPGGGALAGAGVAIPLVIPFIPLPSTSGPTTNPTAFSVPSPTADVNARVEADLRAFKVKAAEAERARFTTFIRFGGGPASQALGEGERRAVLRDALETMRRSDIPQEDLERIAGGQIPKTRNIEEERKQVARALPTFKSIFGQAPDFSNPAHNLAWNTLLYRIRFPRDLKQEQQGIKEFKQLFGRAPRDPFQWSVVRVLGYVQK